MGVWGRASNSRVVQDFIYWKRILGEIGNTDNLLEDNKNKDVENSVDFIDTTILISEDLISDKVL